MIFHFLSFTESIAVNCSKGRQRVLAVLTKQIVRRNVASSCLSETCPVEPETARLFEMHCLHFAIVA